MDKMATSYANENWHLYDSQDYKYGWCEAYDDYVEFKESYKNIFLELEELLTEGE